MSLLARLGLLFVLVPVLELMLLLRVGEWVGLWPTLALILTTGVAGAALARAEGLRVFFQFQKELMSGRLPGQALLDGISVLIGGAFLVTPGILTDLAGFALLVPYTRRLIQARVRRNLERRIRDGTIRVAVGGAGGLRGFAGRAGPVTGGGAGGGPGEWGGPGTEGRPAGTPGGLDPDHEIRVDPPEGR